MYLDSLRIKITRTGNEKFVVFKDGKAVAICETERDAERKAHLEATDIEGF